MNIDNKNGTSSHSIANPMVPIIPTITPPITISSNNIYLIFLLKMIFHQVRNFQIFICNLTFSGSLNLFPEFVNRSIEAATCNPYRTILTSKKCCSSIYGSKTLDCCIISITVYLSITGYLSIIVYLSITV